MCAVIGVVMSNPEGRHFDMIKRIFHESKIRGLHATGISYVKHNKIYTEKHPVPADEFPFDFAEYVNEDGNLYLVGHCRYSTSDLEYNQPISNGNVSVVHNGVVSQELPENWQKLYGYKCETKNDTELILHTIEADKSPLTEWADESLAVCELYADKRLRTYRNGKRPLYLTTIDNGSIITSTKDIPYRANVAGITMEIQMNAYLTFDQYLSMTVEKVSVNNKDLQKVNYEHETVSF